MYCELMAEYQLEAATGADCGYVAQWHVVRQDLHVALCGRVLAGDAETMTVGEVDTVPPERLCHACWARYRQAT